MGRQSKDDSVNEMESIQKGLEAFLEQELQQRKYADEYVEDWDDRSRRRATRTRTEAYREKEEQEETYERRRTRNKKVDKKANKRSKRTRNVSREDVTDNGRSKSKAGKGRGTDLKKKKKSRFKRFLIWIVLLLALLLIGLYFIVGAVYQQVKYEEISSLVGAPMKEDGVVNVLLIGNDSRTNGEDGRSDAMILLSISNRTKKIYMTSLLRDMYVEIPGHDDNRLNAAYSYGGPELLMETIEENLGITVNRYMLVNFEAFANLVDAVNGVDLELTSQEIEYVNGYLVEYNILLGRAEGTDYMDTSQSGVVHLNGAQALAYSRNRFLGTDFGRTERQRKVLSAVIKKLPVAMLTNPKELMDGLLPNLTTNLTQFECYRLGLMGGKILTYDIEQLVIPQPGTYTDAKIRDMAVLQVDFDANREYLLDALQGTTKEEEE